MSKLLFVDRTDSNGKRTFHFLQFSAEKLDFVVKTFYREGSSVDEQESSIPVFMGAASDADKQAFLEAIEVALSLEILPSLRIVEDAK